MLPSSTVENYLKAIHHAQHADPRALVPMGQLAAAMGVVPGTATTMVKTLAESGLVKYEPYAGVRLTPAGEKLAALVLRRHRLIELFLVEIMGMSWTEVHEEAEHLEHAASDRLIERIDEMLGRPEVDPHGDPIPRQDGTLARAAQPSLLTCPLDTPVVVSRVLDQDAAFLRFVEQSDLKPGQRIEVEARNEAADSVRVRQKGSRRVTLGTRAASKLLVELATITLLVAPAAVMASPAGCTVHAAASPAASEPAPAVTRHVRGVIRESRTGLVLPGAVVSVPELSLETVTDREGRFEFLAIPARITHVTVSAPGFRPRTVSLASLDPSAANIELDPDLRYTESVSVSPDARDTFESYQPATVLAGQELSRQLEGTLGAMLDGQPGISQRSFGPGPARPVIRGLDGDRVLVLEDGQRTGDLSSQSADHGVNVNPAAARRVEVVRGPATLLYGANAIGGLVNVISEAIPTRAVTHPTGALTFDFGSAATDAGAAADLTVGVGRGWNVRVGGSGRRNDLTNTPDGPVPNSNGRSGYGNVSVSHVDPRGYVGASYAYDDAAYGIPIVGLGDIRLTPRRHNLTVKLERRGFQGLVESVRGTVAHRRYVHEEIEGGSVGTVFRNTSTEVEFLARQRPAGRLTGTIGAWGLARTFEATGLEALSPPTDQGSAAVFAYEEFDAGQATFQFGGRLDHTRFSPTGGLVARRFTNLSGSAGVLLRLRHDMTLALHVARASRQPALEELYFLGPHIGNFVYEVGNARLDSEHALGTDATFRWRGARASAEVTGFLNVVGGFVFRRPTGEILLDLPVVEFVAADSRLIGLEAQVDVTLGRGWSSRTSADLVRGTLVDTGDPLPRMPPARLRHEVRYQYHAFQAGVELALTARQTRLYPGETSTPGATLGRLFAAWSLPQGTTVHTFTVRVDNVADTLHRNHLSYIKHLVPEMGRNVRVVYSLGF